VTISGTFSKHGTSAAGAFLIVNARVAQLRSSVYAATR
jgi:hypothetical protein